MVMPCSRSARRPSVSRARSSAPCPPRRSLASATCSSWSSNTCLASYSRRPIRVLLPSSTEPAVVKRSRSSVTARPSRRCARRPARGARHSSSSRRPLEVTGLLAILHRRLGHPIVGPGLAALGDSRGGDLEHHLLQAGGLRADAAGAAHVAHGAVANGVPEHLLAVDQLGAGPLGVEHPVTLEHLTLVREVDGGDLELLLVDVLPHVQLRPVRQREHTHVLALADAAVVEVPQLGALVLGVPLPELVAEGEHALLRARALLVPA